MDNYKKFGFIAGQVLNGIGFGLLGTIVPILLTILYFDLLNMHLSLFGEIRYAIIGGYIGILTGIGFEGYKFLKGKNRKSDFIRFFFQSLCGMIVGLLGFYLLMTAINNFIPNSLTNFLAIVLPMTGTIIGFNFGLIQGAKK